jgi:hypothetical protein
MERRERREVSRSRSSCHDLKLNASQVEGVWFRVPPRISSDPWSLNRFLMHSVSQDFKNLEALNACMHRLCTLSSVIYELLSVPLTQAGDLPPPLCRTLNLHLLQNLLPCCPRDFGFRRSRGGGQGRVSQQHNHNITPITTMSASQENKKKRKSVGGSGSGSMSVSVAETSKGAGPAFGE